MAIYEVRVIQTRHIEVLCKVGADSPEEALELAESGDTLSQEEVDFTAEITGNIVPFGLANVSLVCPSHLTLCDDDGYCNSCGEQ